VWQPSCSSFACMSPSAIVLVVDDETDLAETCARFLRRRGYGVVTADSYEQGRAALAGTPPELLVSDVRLPDGNGLDLVRAAGALDPPVPAIVMSAYLSDASARAARAAGAVGVLSKPFATEVLAQTIHKALEPRGA